jgi:hypothetical protein
MILYGRQTPISNCCNCLVSFEFSYNKIFCRCMGGQPGSSKGCKRNPLCDIDIPKNMKSALFQISNTYRPVQTLKVSKKFDHNDLVLSYADKQVLNTNKLESVYSQHQSVGNSADKAASLREMSRDSDVYGD